MVVIGAGGLGHMGIQIIKAMTAADVVAVDVKPAARELAAKSGADVVLDGSAEDIVAQIKEATHGGAEVVLDFVGTDATLATAVGSCKYQSDLTLVGVAGGSFPFNLYAPPYETAMRSIYWGTRAELGEVLALAARGLITPSTGRTRWTRHWTPTPTWTRGGSRGAPSSRRSPTAASADGEFV